MTPPGGFTLPTRPAKPWGELRGWDYAAGPSVSVETTREADGTYAHRVMPAHDRCEWPGCSAEALCVSGNFGGKLVCREHFAATNGTAVRP